MSGASCQGLGGENQSILLRTMQCTTRRLGSPAPVLVSLVLVVAFGCSKPIDPTPEPPPGPASSVLVGAGDIAYCGSPGSYATGLLLDGIQGTVFTAGDNAY